MQEKEQIHMEEKKRLMIVKQENAHYRQMNEEFEKLRKWNHGIKNHLLILSQLAKKEEYDKVIEYIEIMQKETVGQNKAKGE